MFPKTSVAGRIIDCPVNYICTLRNLHVCEMVIYIYICIYIYIYIFREREKKHQAR